MPSRKTKKISQTLLESIQVQSGNPPSLKKNPRIAVVASNGWFFRNLLETNLLVDAGLINDVIVLLDKRIANEGLRLLEAKGVRHEVIDFRYSGPLLVIKSLLLYLEVFKNAPRYSENKFRGFTKTIFLKFLKLLRLVHSLDALHRTIKSIFEWRLAREANHLTFPAFDIFLSASPNAVQDNLVAILSRFSEKPVVNLILSWDNIYAKGYMAPADLYVVWGDVMAKQLSKLYVIPETKMFALGAPHIGGIRLDDATSVQRDTLLYSTAAAVHFPDEKELVERIASDFKAGAFPEFARFVIRTHPAGPNILYDDLANDAASVFVDHPTSLGKREIALWVPDNNELQHLGEQLSRVSVAINLASTMSLDCLAHGIEVINVTFALNGRDISRHYRSEHYASLLELNIVRLVSSYDELVHAIKNSRKVTDSGVNQRIQSFIRPTDKHVLKEFRSKVLNLGRCNQVAPK